MKLNDLNIKFIYENLNAFFPVNITINDFKNGTIKEFSNFEVPDHMKGEEKEIIKRITAKLLSRDKDVVYNVESSKKLRYMGFGIYDEEGYEGAVILGPYLNDLIPSILIKEEERFFYEGISVINTYQQKAIASLINTIINAPQIAKVSIEEDNKALKINQLEYTLDNYELNLEWIKKMYKTERNLIHYVSQGNKEMALKVIDDDDYSWINELNRFPDNPIRNVKNLGVILNTLLRKAIESSGVDEYFIHTISENYALRIENILTVRQMINLRNEMIKEYCDIVNKHNSLAYSELISKAITYIKLNFRKDIGLTLVAKELFIHPTHLAKKFKKETGKTVSEYINEVRIKEAQFIIKVTEIKIEDIAYHVGYNDKKYFSKTFKKITGVSPSEYRKYNKAEK